MTNRRLKERIAIHLGIFCLHTDNFWGTTFLLQKWGVKKENIAQLDYRGEGWPGFMAIHMRNGTKKLIAFDDMIRLLHMYGFFTPMRCTLCCDYTCELADISFGDAWLPELKNDNIGKSMIISRSESGESLLQNAVAKTKIQLDKISRNKVVQAQAAELAFKKSLKARTPFSRLLVKKMPIYNTELLEPKLRAYLDGIWCYLRIYLGSKRYLWGLPFVCESISGTLGRIRDTTSTGK